jgi:chemotaxis protein MotB
MNGLMIRRTVPVVILILAAGGCATKERQRIALLEETNRNLTDRLNLVSADLDSVGGEREELDRRLQTALDEIDALRLALAEQPDPEQHAAPGWTPTPGGAMIAIEGNVLFEPGKVTVRSEARRALDAIVSAVQGEYADKDVYIFGHTDDTPIKKSGWTDNYQLSTERALAVVRYLRDHGVRPERLVASGCGEYRPRAAGISATDRAANRRVEVFAIDASLLATRP